MTVQSHTLKSAEADVALDQARVDQYVALAQFKQVTAPFDGVVTERHIDIGNLVTAGSTSATTPLYVMTQNNPMRVFVDVPQSAAADLAENQLPVEVRSGHRRRTGLYGEGDANLARLWTRDHVRCGSRLTSITLNRRSCPGCMSRLDSAAAQGRRGNPGGSPDIPRRRRAGGPGRQGRPGIIPTCDHCARRWQYCRAGLRRVRWRPPGAERQQPGRRGRPGPTEVGRLPRRAAQTAPRPPRPPPRRPALTLSRGAVQPARCPIRIAARR